MSELRNRIKKYVMECQDSINTHLSNEQGIESSAQREMLSAVISDLNFILKDVDNAELNDLTDLIKDIHQNAKNHGFWKKDHKLSTVISLIHSELSEALEFERAKGNLNEQGIDHLHHYTGKVTSLELVEEYDGFPEVVQATEIISNTPTEGCKKPDGVLPELADVVIRVFDYVGHLEMEEEFVNMLIEKHLFNKTRPPLHGGKEF